MRKIIYIGLIAASYLAGRMQFETKEIKTKEINHNWYLITENNKIPLFNSYNNIQLGSVKYRLEGLLEEEPSELTRNINKIRTEMRQTKHNIK